MRAAVVEVDVDAELRGAVPHGGDPPGRGLLEGADVGGVRGPDVQVGVNHDRGVGRQGGRVSGQAVAVGAVRPLPVALRRRVRRRERGGGVDPRHRDVVDQGRRVAAGRVQADERQDVDAGRDVERRRGVGAVRRARRREPPHLDPVQRDLEVLRGGVGAALGGLEGDRVTPRVQLRGRLRDRPGPADERDLPPARGGGVPLGHGRAVGRKPRPVEAGGRGELPGRAGRRVRVGPGRQLRRREVPSDQGGRADEPGVGPVGEVGRVAVPAVRHDEPEIGPAGHVDVDRDRGRGPGHHARIVELRAVGPHLEDDRARRAGDVVDADHGLEAAVPARQRVLDVARPVDAEALGVRRAVQRDRAAVAGRRAAVVPVDLHRPQAVRRRGPRESAQLDVRGHEPPSLEGLQPRDEAPEGAGAAGHTVAMPVGGRTAHGVDLSGVDAPVGAHAGLGGFRSLPPVKHRRIWHDRTEATKYRPNAASHPRSAADAHPIEGGADVFR